MNLTQIAKIARREFLTRVRNRAFVAMTIMVPLVMGGYMLMVPLLTRSATTELRVAIIDAGTGIGPSFAERLGEVERPEITVSEVVTVAVADAATRERFSDEVRAESIDAYFVMERDDDGLPETRYVAVETGNPELLRDLRLALQAAAIAELLAGTGVDDSEIQRRQRLSLGAVRLSDDGEQAGGFEAAFFSTFALAMLLYMAVIINGQGMATAIVEEKSSRLIEVILGAVTAGEFMAGKIIGVLGAGLTQLGIWVAVALVVVLQAIPGIAMSSAAAGFDLSSVLSVELLFYFAVFFTLGYLLYSVLFAVVAVTCTSTEELGHSMFAAILPLVVALMASLSVITNPGTLLTQVLSFIPFFTPIVMLARINILMPPLWEVWLSVALLLAASLAFAWAAGKIFRYALLMTGKRPTVPELLRVVRAG